MLTVKAWLFDLYVSDKGITLWLIDECGKKIKGYARFTPKFYMHVGREERNRAEKAAASFHCLVSKDRVYKTEIYSGRQIPVLEIMVPDTLHFKNIVRRFESEFSYNVFFNSDLTPVQMFIYEKKLFPLAFGEYSFDGDELTSVELHDTSDAIDYTLPPISVMTLRPMNSEVAPKYQGILNLEAAYDGRTYEIIADTAEELLGSINEHLRRSDPDIIITNYGDDVLLPWLVDISRKTKIPIELNRDKSAVYRTTNESSYWTYGQIVHRSGAFMLAGRWHVDAENSFIVGESDPGRVVRTFPHNADTGARPGTRNDRNRVIVDAAIMGVQTRHTDPGEEAGMGEIQIELGIAPCRQGRVDLSAYHGVPRKHRRARFRIHVSEHNVHTQRFAGDRELQLLPERLRTGAPLYDMREAERNNTRDNRGRAEEAGGIQKEGEIRS